MANSPTILNQNTTAGDSVAMYADSTAVKHQKVILELQTGTNDPNTVSTSFPLPVAQQGTWTVQGTGVAGNVGVNLYDGNGNVLTSNRYGAQQALAVQIVDSGGNQITAFGGSGGTASADASVFTRGTSLLTPVGGYVEASVPTLTAGRISAPSMTLAGEIRMNISSGGAQAGTAGTPSADVLSVQGESAGIPVNVTIIPTGAPGSTTQKIVSAATTNAVNVKATSGVVLSWTLYNTTSSNLYFRFFDNNATPVPGTTVSKFPIMLPANGGSNIDLGGSGGIAFSQGIGYEITAGVADNDATAVAANAVIGQFTWK